MKWLILALCLIPTLYESFTDRRGESKKDKFVDAVWLVVYSALLVGGAWWLGYRPLPVVVLILLFRFAFFDYITHAFLKRYSDGHKQINIWKFTGQTAYFDKLTAKVDWRIRLVLRGMILLASLVLFQIFA